MTKTISHNPTTERGVDTNIPFSLCHLRLPARDKPYWMNQLQTFANHFAWGQVKYVAFGKQDTRGAHSITLVDHNDCVPRQLHFENKFALLYYVQGYNAAHGHDSLKEYTKHWKE